MQTQFSTLARQALVDSYVAVQMHLSPNKAPHVGIIFNDKLKNGGRSLKIWAQENNVDIMHQIVVQMRRRGFNAQLKVVQSPSWLRSRWRPVYRVVVEPPK